MFERIIMLNLERLKKDCFWEYDFNDDDILKMASSENAQEKSFLFQKILLNSTRLFHDLKIFKKSDLVDLLESYKVPPFNYDYIYKRKNIADVYFLDKPLLLNELKWM